MFKCTVMQSVYLTLSITTLDLHWQPFSTFALIKFKKYFPLHKCEKGNKGNFKSEKYTHANQP